MVPDKTRSEVYDLLKGRSLREIRAIGVMALRRWRKESDKNRFQIHGDFGVHFLHAIGIRDEKSISAQKEVFIGCQQEPFMVPIVEFFWWLIRAGLAYPGSWDGSKVIFLCLTEAGNRFLSADNDHPLMPEFVERLQRRCPGLPESVIVHMLDAKACLENGLVRPAVIMLGLAFESAIECILLSLAKAGHGSEKKILNANARVRIGLIKAAIESREMDADEIRRANAARDFADQLRHRRNDGSHTAPTFPLDDGDEVEELIVSAGRHLPALWMLSTAPAK